MKTLRATSIGSWPTIARTIRDVAEYNAATDTTAVVNHVKYDSYGNIVSQTDAAKASLFAYTGREWDADADLYYYRARWYDPSTGRFLSEDPLSFAAGDVNLQRYVGNSPVNFVDPSGMAQEGMRVDESDGYYVLGPDGEQVWVDPEDTQQMEEDGPVSASPESHDCHRTCPPATDSRWLDLYRLGWHRDNVEGRYWSAVRDRDEAWFFPGRSGEEALAAMKQGNAIDRQIEALRHQLSGPGGDPRVREAIGSPTLFNEAVRNAGREMDWFFRGHTIEPTVNPVELAFVTVVTGGIMAPVSGCTIHGAGTSVSVPRTAFQSADEVYGGIRQASKYLQGAGVSRAERVRILQAFEKGTVSFRGAGTSEFGSVLHRSYQAWRKLAFRDISSIPGKSGSAARMEFHDRLPSIPDSARYAYHPGPSCRPRTILTGRTGSDVYNGLESRTYRTMSTPEPIERVRVQLKDALDGVIAEVAKGQTSAPAVDSEQNLKWMASCLEEMLSALDRPDRPPTPGLWHLVNDTWPPHSQLGRKIVEAEYAYQRLR